jgi:hypothetical protein
MMQALGEIVSRGADPANIRVVVAVAAPPALKIMADTYPGAFPLVMQAGFYGLCVYPGFYVLLYVHSQGMMCSPRQFLPCTTHTHTHTCRFEGLHRNN